MRRVFLVVVISAVMVLPAAALAIDVPFTYLERDEDGRFDLVYEAGGSAATLTTTDVLTAPALSPDETRIAFSAVVGDGSLGLYAIYVVNVDGTGLTQLTDGSFGELDPAWSPDGLTIVFSLNETGRYTSCCRLASIPAAGGPVTTLTASVGAVRPAVSPNGSLIAYDTPAGVYTMPAGGGTSTLRASGGFDPSFSPNGEQIAYVWKSGSTYSLRLLTLASGIATTIYSTSRTIEAPDWVGDRVFFNEHSGVGYDSRTSVTIKSMSTSGGSALTERTFSSVVAELDVAEITAPRLGVVAGDVDADGDADVIHRSCGTQPTACWLVHESLGFSFATGQDWGDGAFFSPESDDFGVATGDLDDDGDTDLVYRGYCGSAGNDCWRIQRSTGSGFGGGQNWGNGAYFSNDSDVYGVELGDLDGDGDSDLVYRGFCGSSGNHCWRVQLSTTSAFTGGQDWGNSFYSSPTTDDFGFATADVNADGRDDLVYRGYCGSTGNDCWRVQLSVAFSFSSGMNWGNGVYQSPETDKYGMVAGDVNGDGADDVVYRGYCGSVGNKCWRVQLSTRGGFTGGQNWGDGAFFSPESELFGLLLDDLDGDGDDDLVYRGFCGMVGNTCWRVQLSTGSSFATAQNWGDID